MMPVPCILELPPGFRAQDILEFHSRDPLAVAEHVQGHTLRKGLVWAGRPACLTLELHDDYAEAELLVDGPLTGGEAESLKILVQRMLGLNQNIEEFESYFRQHPQLGPLLARQAGLRVPLSVSPFEALSWAVTGQQISVNAAIALRRKLIQVAGLKHSGGLACYPDADRVAGLSMEELRQAGFSQAKAQTLLTLSRMVQEDRLPLDAWLAETSLHIDEIRERLLGVRGIGPWTVSYALLRGFGWLDGSLDGDAAVRRGMEHLLGTGEKVTADQAREWLNTFSPWRALVAAHLWALNALRLG